MEVKKPLIIIAGPTACGKTAASVALAKKINGEIISGDSMQVYRHMDIGTAKIMPSEMQGVSHYMIDILEPDEEFNAMLFQKMAKQYMSEIYYKNHIPILAGGTGFYINALVYDNNFMETKFPVRAQLEQERKTFGDMYIYERLKECDPQYAASIHPNNMKRVMRALEYFLQTGKKLSVSNIEAHEKETPYDIAFFVLNMDREKLYKRIDMRVEKMFSDGLLEEFRILYERGYNENLVSMQAIGYKELFLYIRGEISLEEAKEKIKADTRHFAKRQITWFKHQCDGIWIDTDGMTGDEVADKLYGILKEKKTAIQALGDI